MNRKKYNKFVAMQIFGLVLLLCGQWGWAMAMFVMAHILSVKPVDDVPAQAPVEPRKKMAYERLTEEGSKRALKIVKKIKVQKKLKDPWKNLTAKSKIMREDDGSLSSFEPNAYVIRGSRGFPVACDYDDDGVPTDRGCEVSGEGWLDELCDEGGMNSTAVVLVHIIKGEDGHLLKALQVNDVKRNGKPLTVSEMAEDGVLLGVAQSLRESYVEESGFQGV